MREIEIERALDPGSLSHSSHVRQNAEPLCVFFSPFGFRDFDDGASLDGSIETLERGSLASFGSGTTTDSETVRVSEVNAKGM